MPADGMVWLDRQDILHYGEMATMVDAFLEVGVTKVRLTGGEPLVRQDLPRLVEMLAQRKAIQDLALTTNGLRLAEHAEALHGAGLHRLTISLDTLCADRFEKFTRRPGLDRVLVGLDVADQVGFVGTKLDTVAIRGFNDDEFSDMVAFARERNLEVRFIEYMDVGGAQEWSARQVVSREEILASLGKSFGPAEPLSKSDWAPADRWRLPDGTVFGIIASTTAPFCATCDRARLTANGTLLRCLYASMGTDLRTPLRQGIEHQGLVALIRKVWGVREDRGAELRLAQSVRGPLISDQELRRSPQLGMSARGG